MEYKYSGRQIDSTKYFEYDDQRGILKEYRAIAPKNTDIRNNHNIFFLKRPKSVYDEHIGEVLGSIIGKKMCFKVCEAELYKSPLPIPNRYINGVISYVDKSKDDILLLPNYIIKDYLKSQNINRDINNYGIDIDTIMNSIYFYMNKNQRPYKEFLDFKQDFIDMMIYDIKLLNTDRGLSNWFIRKNQKTGEIDLYPMFDNERILGFDNDIEEGESELSENDLKKENNIRELGIVTPSDSRALIRFTNYKNITNYLLKKYPIQTQKSLEKANKFTIQELNNILDSIEGIKKNRKIRVLQLFDERTNSINKIYDEFNKNEKEKD